MLGQGEFPEARIRHLEMIQGVVGRLSGHSAASKNFCITIVTGTLGLAAALKAPDLAWLAAAQVLAFALVDAQYLGVERRYRQMFDRVRLAKSEEWIPFHMTPDPGGMGSFFGAIRSWSIWPFYVPAAIGVAVAAYALEVAYGC